jgi:hypothetical protein
MRWYLLYERKLLESCQVPNLEIHVEVYYEIKVLPLPYAYIFSLMNFTVYNQEHFQTNSAVHDVNTRNRNHLHRPVANFSFSEKYILFWDQNIQLSTIYSQNSL